MIKLFGTIVMDEELVQNDVIDEEIGPERRDGW